MRCASVSRSSVPIISLVAIFTLLSISVNLTRADGVIVGPFVPGTGRWSTVPNGGFELGDTTGWSDGGSYLGVFRASQGKAALGQYSAAALPSSSFSGSGFCLRQSVPVNEGETYVLSCFYNAADLSSPALYLDLDDAPYEKQLGGPQLGAKAWQFAWGVFTVPPTVSQVTVRLVRDGTVKMGEIAYIDEVAVTPLNDFVPPTVGKPMVSMVASDGDAGEPANNGQFTVSRTGDTTTALRVYYGTSGSTATGGSDYAVLPGYVDIPSGQASAPIPVDVIDDSLVEVSETVKVTLSSNAAYDIDPSNGFATVTIADNDEWTFAIRVDAQDEAKMLQHYRVNIEITAPNSWPGGDISVVVTEERGSIHATWDIHDNEYWDSWTDQWEERPEATCPLKIHHNGSFWYEDNYKFGTSIPIHLNGGETAYCYLEPYHQWFWVPPWNWSRVLLIIVGPLASCLGDPSISTLLLANKFATALDGQHTIDYTYIAQCQGNVSSDTTKVAVPTHKYVAMGGSLSSSVAGSLSTTAGILMGWNPVGWGLLATEAVCIVAAEEFYITAADPPDFNYAEVAVPQIPDIPELNQIEDPKYLEAAEKSVELAATTIALRTSMERYEGAKIDGQQEYMALQTDAVKSYSQRVAELTDWLSKFWGPISRGLPIPTPQQIQEARDSLLLDGLPDLEVAILSAFGYSTEQMTEIAQGVASLPDEYFEANEKIGEGLERIAEVAAEVHRYISGPNSVYEFVDVSVEHIGYDRQTRRFGVDITVTNISTTTIWTPVWFVIESTSDPLVVLATSDGRTTEDKDYRDLSDLLLNDGKLDPLESISKRIYFYAPNGVRFTFEPSVRGVLLEQPAPGPLEQFSGLSRHWLEGGTSLDMAPVGGDGIVNFRDFALVAEAWLNRE